MARGRFLFIIVLLNCFSKVISDCVVSDWESWQECDKKCAVGKELRIRKVTQKPRDIFSVPCPNLKDTRSCGTKNNGCQNFCEEKSGRCHCKTGFVLSDNFKTCVDINECLTNNGLGPCSQTCSNKNGSYICSCFDGFLLDDENKHDCVYVSAEKCTKYQQRSSTGDCVCKNSLYGMKCDRNASLCDQKRCEESDICSDVKFLRKRCYEKTYQVPILLKIPFNAYNEKNFKFRIESQIESIFEGNTKSLNLLGSQVSRRRKRSSKYTVVYVRGHFATQVKGAFTYVTYIVLDASENFKPIMAENACKTLEKTDVNCISRNDCNILRSVGIPCPYVHEITLISPIRDKRESKSSSLSPWFYALIAGIGIIIICVLLLFYFKRKQKKKLINQNGDSFRFHVDNSEPLLATEASNVPNSEVLSGLQNNTMNKFDKTIFYDKSKDFDDAPIYESIDHLQTDENYVNMASTMYDVPKQIEEEENLKSDKLQVELPNEYVEPRYVSPPTHKIEKL